MTTPHSADKKPAPSDLASRHLWQFQAVRDVMVVAIVVGLVWLGARLQVVTVPVLLALTLAYLFEPVVRWMLRAHWMNRPMAAGAIIAGAALLIGLPITLGVTWGTVQVVQVAKDVAENVSYLPAAVRDPDDPEKISRIPRSWRPFAQRLHELDKRWVFPAPDPEVEPDDPEKISRIPRSWRPFAQRLDKRWAFPAPAPEVEPESGDEAESESALPDAPPDQAEGQPPAAHDDAGARDDAGASDGADPGAPPAKAAEATGGPLMRAVESLANSIREQAGSIATSLSRAAVVTGAGAVTAVVGFFKSVTVISFGAFLTAFFFFFFSTGWGRVLKFWAGIIPERRKGRVFDLLNQMDDVIASFVRGRLLIAAILGVLFTIAYWAIGVPAPLLLGPVVGALSVVPYLALVGIPASILLMLLEPTGEGVRALWWWALVAPVVVYFLIQAIDDYVLTPLIQGEAVGLDAPAIMFAVLAGGALAGFYGILLAIPVAACIKILLKELVMPRVKQWAKGKAPDPLPIG